MTSTQNACQKIKSRPNSTLARLLYHFFWWRGFNYRISTGELLGRSCGIWASRRSVSDRNRKSRNLSLRRMMGLMKTNSRCWPCSSVWLLVSRLRIGIRSINGNPAKVSAASFLVRPPTIIVWPSGMLTWLVTWSVVLAGGKSSDEAVPTKLFTRMSKSRFK